MIDDIIIFMKMKNFILYLLLLNASIGYSQEIKLAFEPLFDDQIIKIGKTYYSPTLDDSVQFETLRFYISDVAFFNDEQKIGELTQRYLLIDTEHPATFSALFPDKNHTFNNIRFNIGIDSLTHLQGVMGDDLDPIHGMYWTWQSGYINFKLEGITSSCPARNHLFQFHIGGYQHPFNTLQKVKLGVKQQENIIIKVAIDQFLASINLQENYQIMSPNKVAMDMAADLAKIFSISK